MLKHFLLLLLIFCPCCNDNSSAEKSSMKKYERKISEIYITLLEKDAAEAPCELHKNGEIERVYLYHLNESYYLLLKINREKMEGRLEFLSKGEEKKSFSTLALQQTAKSSLLNLLRDGMDLVDLISVIGKKYKIIGSGAGYFCWDLRNDKSLWVHRGIMYATIYNENPNATPVEDFCLLKDIEGSTVLNSDFYNDFLHIDHIELKALFGTSLLEKQKDFPDDLQIRLAQKVMDWIIQENTRFWSQLSNWSQKYWKKKLQRKEFASLKELIEFKKFSEEKKAFFVKAIPYYFIDYGEKKGKIQGKIEALSFFSPEIAKKYEKKFKNLLTDKELHELEEELLQEFRKLKNSE